MNEEKLFGWMIVGLLLGHAAGASAVSDFQTRREAMQWFEGARLGVFVHWDARSNWSDDVGRYNVDIRPSMKKAQEDAMWNDVSDDRGKPAGRKRWQTWNPSQFEADKWVQLFLDAGARYLTFTTMHMWCLSNFDHPSTSFDIMSTPYGKDVAAQLAEAAKDKITVMWYYNMYPDKHVKGDRWDHFKMFLNNPDITWDEFRKTGIHALVRNMDTYGKVAGIWCDGGGFFEDNAINKDFYRGMKEVQPWLIFSPRCGHSEVPKDWRVPEQKMPRLDWQTHQEMTMPIESSLWFWAQGKHANTKDVEYCVQSLIKTATRDANLLVNISPKGDGSIDDYQAQILRGLGRWMRQYGQSIYGTRAGVYAPGLWGGSTRKGKTVYLHLTQLSQNGTYMLPALPSKIVSYTMLNGSDLDIQQTDDALAIRMDSSLASDKDVINRVVKLELADDAWRLLPEEIIPVHEGEPINATASASSENTYVRPSGKRVSDSAGNVINTGEGGGVWTASEPWSKTGLDPNPWLMLDLGSVKAFRTVYLKEHHSRIYKFVVEYKDPKTSRWKTIFSGRRLNYFCYKLDKPVSAKYIRVRLPEVRGGAPQIDEFSLYQ